MKSRTFLATAAAAVLTTVHGSTTDHRYSEGEHVELWVNKVRKDIL